MDVQGAYVCAGYTRRASHRFANTQQFLKHNIAKFKTILVSQAPDTCVAIYILSLCFSDRIDIAFNFFSDRIDIAFRLSLSMLLQSRGSEIPGQVSGALLHVT